jgi:hypothetical protein
MSLTVTAGISGSLVQNPRLIELSTTCNLSAFLIKQILEIQGFGQVFSQSSSSKSRALM